MNNTKRTTLAIVAILTAATLVVGTFATTTQSTQTAFAYSPKKDNKRDGKDGGNDNGNTITIEKCKQAATQSGWDNNQGQECENLICTHPGENATCVQEGAVVTPIPTPAPEPTTTTLRIVKQAVCLPTDPNCLSRCSMTLSIGIGPGPPEHEQTFTCQSALGNGVVFTLQPGDNFFVSEATTAPPFFDLPTFEGDCRATIAEGQHLTCTITNTEEAP